MRESGRARRLSIKVYPRGRVEVVVPRRTSARAVRSFVEAHQDWIDRTREAFLADHVPEPFALPVIIDMPAVERSYRVHYRPQAGALKVAFRKSAQQIVLTGATTDDVACVSALKRCLTGIARSEFHPRLQALARDTDNGFKKLQVRGQRTCWGSHSSSGTISLNYCLLFLEPALLRYVMIHELCHARHMNHSRRFWSLVGRYEPDYRRLDRSLNECWKKIPTWVGIY